MKMINKKVLSGSAPRRLAPRCKIIREKVETESLTPKESGKNRHQRFRSSRDALKFNL
jgi:hypothetical protein